MKTWWGLAASALSLVIIVLGYAAMAAGLPTAERLARNEVVVGIDVPLVGTVGAYPDPQHRHVVNVTRDGRITVEGRTPATLSELAEILKELAALSQGTPIPGTKRFLSGESFVIRADAASAWRDAMLVYMASCEASADRVFFAVRNETDGSEGALALFLPMDSCRHDHPEWEFQRVVIVPGEGTESPAALYASTRDAAARVTKGVAIQFDVAGEVTTGTVLAWIDAAFRAGAAFDGPSCGSPPKLSDPIPCTGPPPTSTVIVRRAIGAPGHSAPNPAVDPGIALAPVPAAAAMPPVARVRGVFAGQAVSFRPSHE